MQKNLFPYNELFAAIFLVGLLLSPLANAQDSINDLGFDTVDSREDGWGENEQWGWMVPTGDGWIFHDWTHDYFWSGGFGTFDSAGGIYLYRLSTDAWIWTNTTEWPWYLDLKRDVWEIAF